jgi:nucleoside-diphosphate-sugar epimerase
MTSLVFGAGGFIGSHLVKALREKGRFVIGVDRHLPRFMETSADVFYECDIRNTVRLLQLINGPIDEVYQLCAFLGGSQIIDTGNVDADMFMNNMSINISVLEFCKQRKVPRIFFSSSACVGSTEPVNVYGWEKYASEKMYDAFAKQYGVKVRIGRLYNVYGPYQEFRGGRERVISALCRKVIEGTDTLHVLGNGKSIRSFLFVEDCVSGIQYVMDSNCSKPIEIGSSRLLSIDDLAYLIMNHANKQLHILHSSDSNHVDIRNCKAEELQSLGWREQVSLEEGLQRTFDWIAKSCATIS